MLELATSLLGRFLPGRASLRPGWAAGGVRGLGLHVHRCVYVTCVYIYIYIYMHTCMRAYMLTRI